MTRGTSLSLLAGLALVSTGCGQPAPRPTLAPSTGAQAGAGDEPTSATPAQRPRPDRPGELPSNQFDGVPGWLGFVVRPADERTYGWTPDHVNASAVILDADTWSAIKEGTKFRLVSREGNLPVTLSEVSRLPYDCAENEINMAGFRTPHTLAEQLVWILPESHAAASALPVITGPASKLQRSWTVGPLAIQVQLDGKHEGRMEIREGGALVLARQIEKPALPGQDKTKDKAQDKPQSKAAAKAAKAANKAANAANKVALDLTQEFEIGVPYAEAAFQLGPALTIVVLRTVGHEGVEFEVLALRKKLEPAGTQSVLRCTS